MWHWARTQEKKTQFLNFTSRSWEVDTVFQSHVQSERKIAHSVFLTPKELVKALLHTFSDLCKALASYERQDRTLHHLVLSGNPCAAESRAMGKNTYIKSTSVQQARTPSFPGTL